MYFELAQLTSPEAEDIGQAKPALALIPTGSFEQHGPHLPLITDSVLADALAKAVAASVEATVVVPPVIHTGLSSLHLGFGGTITLSDSTFCAILDAYIEMLGGLGLCDVALFSGHGGNFRVLGAYSKDASARHKMNIASYSDFARLISVLHNSARRAGLSPAETDSHAGVFETSLVLHVLGADAVRPFDAVVGWAGDDPQEERRKPGGVKKVSPTGVFGTPKGANADAGRVIFDAWASDLTEWICQRFGLRSTAQPVSELASPEHSPA